MQFHVKAGAAQSCQDLLNHGFDQDGVYLLDPDGRYQSEPSFKAICEFYVRSNEVLTKIPRDFNEPINIFANNTYDVRYRIGYNASVDEIMRLIKNSGTCYQQISFGCYLMPLHFESVNHGYWKGNDGKNTEQILLLLSYNCVSL